MHMRETAEQLAAALRALSARISELSPALGVQMVANLTPWQLAAREALARYDAERAQAEDPHDHKQAAYIESRGCACPNCGSADIEGSGIEVDAGTAWQAIWCLACDANWTDDYTLTGFDNLDIPAIPGTDAEAE